MSGWSYAWDGGESSSSDAYYKYDRYTQGLAWTIAWTGTYWGSVANSVVFRVTQGGYQYARISVLYASHSIWSCDYRYFPTYWDGAETGWHYLSP